MIAAGALGCGDNEPPYGHVLVSATVVDGSGCPDILSVVAAPAQTSVGGQIALNAIALPARATETLAYVWAPATGIKPVSSASSVYTCAKAGRQTLTLTITETNRSGSCVVEETLNVLCL
ncbi:MAG TPA: hypothetical protein VMT03_00235 [Polyangia bacterium]|nr:hypothetical protein [Polyangia bacterium]